MESPGAWPGTRKAEMPRFPAAGSVLARATNQRATFALVIQAFSPFSTQESPSRVAVVFIAPASLPDPGSVRQKPPMWPLASSGSALRFTVSDPKRTIGQAQTELVTDTVTAVEGQTRASSSIT